MTDLPLVVVLYWVSGAMLILAASLAIARLALGPTILDRAVAADLITAVGIGVVALLIIWWDRTDLRALMVIFALTGFFSSVTIARFTDREDVLEARILTPEETAVRDQAEKEQEEMQADLEEVAAPFDYHLDLDEPAGSEERGLL